jgi:hypothetical protein
MPSLSSAVLAAVALTLPALPAQTRPDFSGTWTMDRERSESPHQGASFEPPTFVITQTDAEVTVETRLATARSEARYPIESTTAASRAGTRAYWDGASLVTEGTRNVQGKTVSVRETRTLDASGTEMILETLLVVQHGYTFKGAQNYGAARDVYRRVTPDRHEPSPAR